MCRSLISRARASRTKFEWLVARHDMMSRVQLVDFDVYNAEIDSVALFDRSCGTMFLVHRLHPTAVRGTQYNINNNVTSLLLLLQQLLLLEVGGVSILSLVVNAENAESVAGRADVNKHENGHGEETQRRQLLQLLQQCRSNERERCYIKESNEQCSAGIRALSV